MAAPKIDAPSVMPSGKPLRYLSVDTNADMFGAGIGRAVTEFGATITNVGAAIEENNEKLRLEGAKTAANQAFVDATMASNESSAEYLQTMGTNAAAGYVDYTEKLKTIRQQALDSLEDDDAKKLFDRAFQSEMLSASNSGATHAAQQGRAAAVDSSKARVEIIMNDSSTKFMDEELFQSNLTELNKQLAEQGRLMGWGPDVLLSQIKQQHSLAWESRITSMAMTDPRGALQLFSRVRDDLSVESRLRVQSGVVQTAQNMAIQQSRADIRTGTNGDVRPAFHQAILNAEGGGSGVYSPKGAAGIMQVMPETARNVALSLGIPYNARRLAYDNEYNSLIGTTYLNQMLDRYGGDEMLAAAAYNAGPGRVDEWLAKYGDPRIGMISREAWAASIPFDETRGYVAKVMGYTGGQPRNAPVTGTMPRSEFTAIVEEKRAWAQANFPGDTVFENALISGIEQEYNDLVAAHNAELAANYDGLLGLILPIGEEGDYVNQADFMAALQNNPMLNDMWESLEPTKKNTILTQLRRNDELNNKTKNDQVDEINLAEYQRLSGMWRTNNSEFLQQDIAANAILNNAQKKQLIDKQGQNPPSGATPADINMSKALQLAGPALVAAELNINAKSDEEEKQRYYKFTGALSQALDEQTQLNGGKALSEVQMLEIVRQLLMPVNPRTVTPMTLFGDWPYPYEVSDGFVFEADRVNQAFPGAELAPVLTPIVPTDHRQMIIESYTRKNGKPPTEAIINQLYFQMRKNRVSP